MLSALLAAVLLVLPTAAAGERPFLSGLAKLANFDADDIREMEDGTLVAELDVANRSSETAFVGLIRIERGGNVLNRRLLAPDTRNVGGSADHSGFFGDPATVGDLAELAFPDDDLEVLSECEPGSCKFKLSRTGIAQVQTIDWNSDGAGDHFTRIFRRELVDYVNRYRDKGNASLIVYGDKPEPLSLAAAIETLSKEMVVLRNEAPALHGYILTYPNGKPEGVFERVYWSVKNFGYRPTLAVEQILISYRPEIEGAETLVVFKTIYDNHYLAARIAVGGLLDGETAFGVPGTYLLLVDRTVFDGELGDFKRGLLARGIGKDVDARLRFVRDLAHRGG